MWKTEKTHFLGGNWLHSNLWMFPHPWLVVGFLFFRPEEWPGCLETASTPPPHSPTPPPYFFTTAGLIKHSPSLYSPCLSHILRPSELPQYYSCQYFAICMSIVSITKGVTLFSLLLPRLKLEDLWSAKRRTDLSNMESPLGDWTVPSRQSLFLSEFLLLFLGSRVQWLPTESGSRLAFLESSPCVRNSIPNTGLKL